jgi:hypothetical protein
VFGQAARQKARLEKANNVIDAASSAKMSEDARSKLNIVGTYGAAPGTHSNEVLRTYAVKLAQNPDARKQILSEAFDAMLKATDEDVPTGTPLEDDKTGKLF